MRITYQGTAAAEGVPAMFCRCAFCRHARAVGGKEIRMRSGALIDGALKLDFGPDAYVQSLREPNSYEDVLHVLITHSHADHLCVQDLGRVTPPNAQGRAEPLTVYGNERVGELLREAIEQLGGMLRFERVRPFEPRDIGGYRVTPLRAVHAPQEEALIYLIERDGRSILYAHDTDVLPEEDMDFLRERRVSLISMDCTNGVLEPDYIGHMGIADNLRLRERLLSIGAADESTIFVANHFSHNGLVSYAEMALRMPDFVVSYDGMTLSV